MHITPQKAVELLTTVAKRNQRYAFINFLISLLNILVAMWTTYQSAKLMAITPPADARPHTQQTR